MARSLVPLIIAVALCASGCEFLDRAGLGDVFGGDAEDAGDADLTDASGPGGPTVETDLVALPPGTPGTGEPTGTPTGEPTGEPTPSTSGACGMNAEEFAVLDLTNGARASEGLGALRCDATLANAALAHSDDMCRRDFFDHTNPEGEGPGIRAERAGADFSWVGENIAWGYVDAADVHEGWMTSPGHRDNILTPDYGRLGVGMIDCAGAKIWTQVFAD